MQKTKRVKPGGLGKLFPRGSRRSVLAGATAHGSSEFRFAACFLLILFSLENTMGPRQNNVYNFTLIKMTLARRRNRFIVFPFPYFSRGKISLRFQRARVSSPRPAKRFPFSRYSGASGAFGVLLGRETTEHIVVIPDGKNQLFQVVGRTASPAARIAGGVSPYVST